MPSPCSFTGRDVTITRVDLVYQNMTLVIYQIKLNALGRSSLRVGRENMVLRLHDGMAGVAAIAAQNLRA
jgi:hypothetical protein